MATMANFKPSPCLQTARVATSCDACGVEVGSEALRCHLVEERARIAFYCPSCCYICQKAKTGTPKGQTRGGKQLTDSGADVPRSGAEGIETQRRLGVLSEVWRALWAYSRKFFTQPMFW